MPRSWNIAALQTVCTPDLTGAAHWALLLRARAVEYPCDVLAPAQGGLHENGRHGASPGLHRMGRTPRCR